MTNDTLTAPDLERLSERIEKAAAVLQRTRDERDRLQKERDTFARRAQELERKLQGQDPGSLMVEVQTLRRQQRDWQAERRDLASRIESLLKKLEKLEA